MAHLHHQALLLQFQKTLALVQPAEAGAIVKSRETPPLVLKWPDRQTPEKTMPLATPPSGTQSWKPVDAKAPLQPEIAKQFYHHPKTPQVAVTRLTGHNTAQKNYAPKEKRIADVFAELSPEKKAAAVRRFNAECDHALKPYNIKVGEGYLAHIAQNWKRSNQNEVRALFQILGYPMGKEPAEKPRSAKSNPRTKFREAGSSAVFREKNNWDASNNISTFFSPDVIIEMQTATKTLINNGYGENLAEETGIPLSFIDGFTYDETLLSTNERSQLAEALNITWPEYVKKLHEIELAAANDDNDLETTSDYKNPSKAELVTTDEPKALEANSSDSSVKLNPYECHFLGELLLDLHEAEMRASGKTPESYEEGMNSETEGFQFLDINDLPRLEQIASGEINPNQEEKDEIVRVLMAHYADTPRGPQWELL